MKITTQHLETKFNKTYKSMNRFYTLYFYNTFKSKSFSKWQRISKNIQNKIKEKEIIHQYATKLFLNNSSVSDKKEEKKEETKILKKRYKMKLELIINDLKNLKNEFEKGKNLKNYCICKNISYTSTSRILKNRMESMTLRTAYNILGLTPDRNISQGILSKKINDLKLIKNCIIEGNI